MVLVRNTYHYIVVFGRHPVYISVLINDSCDTILLEASAHSLKGSVSFVMSVRPLTRLSACISSAQLLVEGFPWNLDTADVYEKSVARIQICLKSYEKWSKSLFFPSVISNQSTWVLYELMCCLSLVVSSPPARRSLSWIQATVDWCMAPRKWGF